MAGNLWRRKAAVCSSVPHLLPPDSGCSGKRGLGLFSCGPGCCSLQSCVGTGGGLDDGIQSSPDVLLQLLYEPSPSKGKQGFLDPEKCYLIELFPKPQLFLFNLQTRQLVLLATMMKIHNRTLPGNMIWLEVFQETNLLYLQAIKLRRSKFLPFITSWNTFDRSFEKPFSNLSWKTSR